MNCVTCGDVLDPDRVAHDYTYCTRPECQAKNFRGARVVSVPVNKAAPQFRLATVEVEEQARAGLLGKKNAGLGADGVVQAGPASSVTSNASRRSTSSRRSGMQTRTQRPVSRPWTDAQERYVRARVASGATPQQIALDTNGRTSARLVVQIMGTPVRRVR